MLNTTYTQTENQQNPTEGVPPSDSLRGSSNSRGFSVDMDKFVTYPCRAFSYSFIAVGFGRAGHNGFPESFVSSAESEKTASALAETLNAVLDAFKGCWSSKHDKRVDAIARIIQRVAQEAEHQANFVLAADDGHGNNICTGKPLKFFDERFTELLNSRGMQ